MKKLFTVMAIFALVLAGCGGGDSEKNNGDSDYDGNDSTSLKIQNESFSGITNVKWSSWEFGSIGRGSYAEMRYIEKGMGYIYFNREMSPINARTDELIAVSEGEQRTFVITDNTIIVDVNNTGNKGAFGTLAVDNYSVGKTGPGGGMVFFASGGQYKECSADLGTYTWDEAVTAAANYRGGGFSDWHLPDQGELNLMHQNLHKNGLGGFQDSTYWSSSQNGNDAAWSQSFDSLRNGEQYSSFKYHNFNVRAVRSF